MTPEEEAKMTVLSKEKLKELVHHSMDVKVEGLKALFESGLSSNQQEQAMKMMKLAADNEDAFFERTGVELGEYSLQATNGGMLDDPEFKKVITAGQARI